MVVLLSGGVVNSSPIVSKLVSDGSAYHLKMAPATVLSALNNADAPLQTVTSAEVKSAITALRLTVTLTSLAVPALFLHTPSPATTT
ncbi:hypothetical protein D3C72_564240 [compost metagenome]